jgi:hypothetical protein
MLFQPVCGVACRCPPTGASAPCGGSAVPPQHAYRGDAPGPLALAVGALAAMWHVAMACRPSRYNWVSLWQLQGVLHCDRPAPAAQRPLVVRAHTLLLASILDRARRTAGWVPAPFRLHGRYTTPEGTTLQTEVLAAWVHCLCDAVEFAAPAPALQAAPAPVPAPSLSLSQLRERQQQVQQQVQQPQAVGAPSAATTGAASATDLTATLVALQASAQLLQLVHGGVTWLVETETAGTNSVADATPPAPPPGAGSEAAAAATAAAAASVASAVGVASALGGASAVGGAVGEAAAAGGPAPTSRPGHAGTGFGAGVGPVQARQSSGIDILGEVWRAVLAAQAVHGAAVRVPTCAPTAACPTALEAMLEDRFRLWSATVDGLGRVVGQPMSMRRVELMLMRRRQQMKPTAVGKAPGGATGGGAGGGGGGGGGAGGGGGGGGGGGEHCIGWVWAQVEPLSMFAGVYVRKEATKVSPC